MSGSQPSGLPLLGDSDEDPLDVTPLNSRLPAGADGREPSAPPLPPVVKVLRSEEERMVHLLGPLSSSFPVENRITTVTLRALKDHLNRAKHLPFVKRISDFHLLLLVARYLDVNADVPALAMCVNTQSTVPEGYQLLIESLAAAS